MSKSIPDTSAALRVAIGEDDVLLREGIARLLTEAGFEVVFQSGDAESLLRRALAHRPEVAIVDVRMPPHHEHDGLDAAIELRRRLPGTAVLILSQFYEPTFALELMSESAEGVGYLLKERVADVHSFVSAVTRVASGGSALDAEVVARLMGRARRHGPLDDLTRRELDVLAVMAEGKSNVGIAEVLGVSEAAVEKHTTGIFRKLGVETSATEHRRVHAVLAFLSQRDDP
jgi:DNA-binding NarL/FixJ family response regulator